jgi:hypothetical protein
VPCGGGIGTDSTCDRSGELTITNEYTFICSTDKGKAGLTQSSGMISNIRTSAAMTTAHSVVDKTEGEAGKGKELSLVRVENQP